MENRCFSSCKQAKFIQDIKRHRVITLKEMQSSFFLLKLTSKIKCYEVANAQLILVFNN